MSPRAHQTPPEQCSRCNGTGVEKAKWQRKTPCWACNGSGITGWVAAHFLHGWPAGIDWPLPSHPEYPPEDEAQETPDEH